MELDFNRIREEDALMYAITNDYFDFFSAIFGPKECLLKGKRYPLVFLNAAMMAKVLGVSPSSSYELMHETDFPVLRVGNLQIECRFQICYDCSREDFPVQ